MQKIIREYKNGCDLTLELDRDEITLLQLTDTQIIDESQSRAPERLGHDERTAWARKNTAKNCYDHIRSLVAQSRPDLIFFTGDAVYGSFDDSGEIFEEFVCFMDSLDIPWTMVFGNHDNESQIGAARQCELLEGAKNCLFRRTDVSGNSNFTIGISYGGKLKRVLYMLDSHGCLEAPALRPDQISYMRERGKSVLRNAGNVPGFAAFHIPVELFHEAEYAKGYSSPKAPNYILGVSVDAKDGDFGFNMEDAKFASPYIKTGDDFLGMLTDCRIDGIFVGHCHKIATSVSFEGIRLTFGLKTGQYDYHLEGQLGGTMITLDASSDAFRVNHIPSLVRHGPFPAKGSTYTDNFLVE